MKDKLIFDALKRDGECWHNYVWHTAFELCSDKSEGICECGGRHSVDHSNPDFSTLAGLGWVMERLSEWERREEFIASLRTETSLCCVHEEHIPLSRLNPTAMRDALIKFIEGE